MSAGQLGFIGNIGGAEVVVILFLALVVLGPDRLPEMARGAGRMVNNVKRLTTDLSGEMQDVINDPAMKPIKELGEFATRPRQKLAEYALEAEAEERAKRAAEPTAAADPAADPAGEPAGSTEPAPPTAPQPEPQPEPQGEGAGDPRDPGVT